jgi:DNA-binding response OmpR family regulator
MDILIAEDEPLIAFELEAELLEAGYTVIGPVATVEEALAASEVTPPELALLNIDLQRGGSGVVLARTLLQRYGAPSIFISGNPREAGEAHDAALGYISKPFFSGAVVAAVKVAKAIIAGQEPGDIPEGFELFR